MIRHVAALALVVALTIWWRLVHLVIGQDRAPESRPGR